MTDPSPAPSLTRDEILAIDDYIYEDVLVPEWGNKRVRICRLTGTGRDAFEAESISQRGKNIQMNYQNMRARLLVRVIVDDQRRRVFTDSDVAALGSKSAAVLDRLFDVARRLSGLRQEDLDSLAKNSETGQSDASITASA